MNSNFQNPSTGHGAAYAADCNAEETLRLIANLPAPEGIEDRVHEALRSAPRRGLVFAWPVDFLRGEWMRTAAAAAIAFVIAGGGWSVYSRVQQGQPAKIMVMPAHGTTPGGFSSAGAMRTPQTLSGPVIAQPAKAHSAQKSQKKAVHHPSKAAAKPAAVPVMQPAQ
jgi:hypothetical protein